MSTTTTTTKKPLLDQSDYMQANATLANEITTLETELRANGKVVPARPTAAAGADVIAANDALTCHKALLIGIKSGVANATKANAQATKPKTLTEKVLDAKGCKTLAELAQKPADNID